MSLTHSSLYVQIMYQMIDTGLHKCVRQYAMEIHMPNPLYNRKSMERCNNITKSLKTLEESGYRLFETVDNIRYLKSLFPEQNQLSVKRKQFSGQWSSALWETHFINTDVAATCKTFFK